MTEREHDRTSRGTHDAQVGAGAPAETDRTAPGQGAGGATGSGMRDPDAGSEAATREAVERATAAVGAEDDRDRRDG